MNKPQGSPQITPHDPEHLGSRRDPEERPIGSEGREREKSFDKTLADSFPTSDPPSSIPDPGSSANAPARHPLLAGLKPGTWVAVSIDRTKVLGQGATQEEAQQDARKHNYHQIELMKVS